MQRRRILAEIATGAVILLPPPGDEFLGLMLGAAIMKGGSQMEDTTSEMREPRRKSSAPAQNITVYVGVLVIGSLIVLAIMAGGMSSLVQH